MTGKLHRRERELVGDFAFAPENLEAAQMIVARYPGGKQQSAVMPLLALAQRQSGGWLPKSALDCVAGLLGVARSRVYEVATFYNMYNLDPVGRNVVNVCTTTPCWLRGSGDIVAACEKHLGVACGETTADGEFTLREVECLGACVNAPMCQIINAAGEYFYEDLTPESAARLLEALAAGGTIKPGPQSGRKSSEPEGETK
ncbi:MAG: NAD(P)H-dependent oxidoreductase subunit E [Pseudomonadota bacterium]|nr:NAD(P)H-dependent oxidoreductase subunit E [Pseudomonadota bacterium]MDE3038716.1 NAD(P)H-dependent oxidoreductase subunit E [Pseudomonadota bacterium]